MKLITTDDVRDWYLQARDLSSFTRSIGFVETDNDAAHTLNLPLHLQFAIEELARQQQAPVEQNAFDSISFYSLCKGLFLPLSGMTPERAAQFFGIALAPTTDRFRNWSNVFSPGRPV